MPLFMTTGPVIPDGVMGLFPLDTHHDLLGSYGQ